MHTQYTEYLSAWELHAVFKQIIKGKVRGSCGGHFLGYSSECVHYPGRKQAGGGSSPLLFNVGNWFLRANKPLTHFQVAYQKLLLQC